ncbi:MAG: Yip1 family protein [Pseudomonadota bacterium]
MGELIQHLVKLFTKSDEYWKEVSTKPGEIKTLLVPQILILAAIPMVAQFFGLFLGSIPLLQNGYGGRVFWMGVYGLVIGYPISIAMWIALGHVIDALATNFGAQKNLGQSFKLASGAMTPIWLAGVFYFLPFPAIGWLATLAGFAYGSYVLYLGLPIMNTTPKEKAAAYALVSMGILIILSFVFFSILYIPRACCLGAAQLASGGILAFYSAVLNN